MEAVPGTFNTAEFRRSDGSADHNAASAWAAGATGTGVTIAVIDTGIDLDSPEFAGRISPASTDIYGTRGAEASDDHGTNVAMVAAAARNGTGVLGIAWNATVLAIRADQPGSCGADNPQDPETDCTFLDSIIADSVDYAVANGAKVVNISLGGGSGSSQRLRNAVRNAVDAGLLIVIAAGNDGLAELEDFGQQLATAGDGGLVVVGSVDANYQISDFSNRAGANPGQYLVALGERICCVYEDGEIFVDDEGFAYLFSGTSFASPQVAGAGALLAQAFPHLTGREIAEILLQSAFDAGDPGPDAIYGRGILNIAAAFRPIGTTSIAGQNVALALTDSTGIASPAMGDAFGTASLPTLVTDRYRRAFSTNLAGTLRGAQLQPRLHGALSTRQRHLSGASNAMSVAFTIDATGRTPPRAQSLYLSSEDAEQARVLAARAAFQLSPDTQFAFAYREGADGMVAGMQGQERPAFMIAGSARGDAGMLASTDASVALRHQWGEWGLTVSADSGSTHTAAVDRRAAQLLGQYFEEDVTRFGAAFDRRFGALDTAIGFNWMAEDRTLLGARLHEGFGFAGSNSLFVDLDIGWRPADRWRLGASWRQGFTHANSASLVADGSNLQSNAWSLDVERTGLFTHQDRIALRLSQPMRVTRGGLNLRLPSSFSYETLTPDYTVQSLLLSPEGQELAAELAWRGRLLGGGAATSLFYRHEPGHYESAPADMGVAVRWSRAF